jgi:hypothetical protein
LKKFFVIILLFLFVFNIGGAWLLYEWQKITYYLAAREELKSCNTYTVLKLTHNEFDQSRTRQNEIMIHGEMFDFFKVEMHHDTVYIFCIRDIKEEGLITAFFSFLKKKQQQNPDELLTHVINLLTLTFTVPENISVDRTVAGHFLFAEWTNHFRSVILQIKSPPPKV